MTKQQQQQRQRQQQQQQRQHLAGTSLTNEREQRGENLRTKIITRAFVRPSFFALLLDINVSELLSTNLLNFLSSGQLYQGQAKVFFKDISAMTMTAAQSHRE